MGEREVGQQEELARIRVEVRSLSFISYVIVKVDSRVVCEKGAPKFSSNGGISVRDC